MLDTGASGVAIPEAVARRLGIPRGRAFQTQTAIGITTSYAANLESVSVGGIELHDIRAGITPGLHSEQVLLGMSFLKHIEFTQRGDKPFDIVVENRMHIGVGDRRGGAFVFAHFGADVGR